MENIDKMAQKFIARIKAGKGRRIRIPKEDLGEFLMMLSRYGIPITNDCLNQIEDRNARNHAKTVIFASAGGAVIGGVVGGAVTAGNPKGVIVGSAVGTGIGLIAGMTAVAVSPDEDPSSGLAVITVN